MQKKYIVVCFIKNCVYTNITLLHKQYKMVLKTCESMWIKWNYDQKRDIDTFREQNNSQFQELLANSTDDPDIADAILEEKKDTVREMSRIMMEDFYSMSI